MNSLPETVARQRRDCDLNSGPSAPESSTLTTRLPSHPHVVISVLDSRVVTQFRALRLSSNNFRQVVQAPVLLSPSCLTCYRAACGQCAMMPGGWEGNRRSAVALFTRHRLYWFAAYMHEA